MNLFESSDDSDEETIDVTEVANSYLANAPIEITNTTPLPVELFVHIFHYLSQSDLVYKISMLSRSFYQFIYNFKYAHLIWDFRLINFANGTECYNACVRWSLLRPKHLRIRVYHHLSELILILLAVKTNIVELRLKQQAKASETRTNSEIIDSMFSALQLPELRRIAVRDIHAEDYQLLKRILFAAPNLIQIDYLPQLSLIYEHPNWNNFTGISIDHFDLIARDDSLQQAISSLTKLKTFEVKHRVDKDIVEQVLTIPTLERVSIYCGKTLRKTVNHFNDLSINISPNLRRIKFTKYKSCSNFLGKTGQAATHLQLYTCNPVSSAVCFTNYTKLTYLASFKSLTIPQIQSIITNCKMLKHFYFKPVYTEQTISTTDWNNLLAALSKTHLRNLGLNSMKFSPETSPDQTWFTQVTNYLPRLNSMIFAGIQTSESESAASAPLKILFRLRRYDIVGEGNFGIDHVKLFTSAPNLAKLVFKQRKVSFDELEALSRKCVKLREIVCEQGVTNISKERKRMFFYFGKLSKASISFDIATSTISDVLLCALLFHKATSFNISVPQAAEMWRKAGSPKDRLAYLQKEAISLIHSQFEATEQNILRSTLDDCLNTLQHLQRTYHHQSISALSKSMILLLKN